MFFQPPARRPSGTPAKASAAAAPAWMPASPEAQTAAYEQRTTGLQSLKFREIEAVRKQMIIDARDTCHETRAAYVECAKGGDPATTQPRGCLIAPVVYA